MRAGSWGATSKGNKCPSETLNNTTLGSKSTSMHCISGSNSAETQNSLPPSFRYFLAAMQKTGPYEPIIRSRSRSPAPKKKPITQVYVRSRSRSPIPKTTSTSQTNSMLAFSKQKAMPSTSHMSMSNELTSIKTVRRTGKEEVVTEVHGDGNMIREIRGPYNTGAPFSCSRCGHQSFLALCKESEMVWAIRCLHCYLIHPIYA